MRGALHGKGRAVIKFFHVLSLAAKDLPLSYAIRTKL